MPGWGLVGGFIYLSSGWLLSVVQLRTPDLPSPVSGSTPSADLPAGSRTSGANSSRRGQRRRGGEEAGGVDAPLEDRSGTVFRCQPAAALQAPQAELGGGARLRRYCATLS